MSPPLAVCADWSAGRKGRAAWAADVVEDVVFRLEPPARGWTVDSLLADVEQLRGEEPALVCFDAPIGVPASFLDAWGYPSFPDWLADAPFDDLFAPVTEAGDWSALRPFVRPGPGEWKAVRRLAGEAGLELMRNVDVRSNAESMFKLVGPKQVGRAAQELWRELRAARLAGHPFRLWPFEADLDGSGVVVAEIYPRAAYVEVIGPAGVVKREHRSRIGVATRLRPEVDDPSSAAATEDDLDAAITAVALLRRLRADMPLANEATVDRRAEGGILCV